MSVSYPSHLGQCAEIVGGKESKPHSRPYMAIIKGNRLCGGTLIKQNWVLTAAHCQIEKTTKVILGAHSISKSESTKQNFTIVKQVPYPCYDQETHEGDLMLLQLNVPAKINRYVKTVKLPLTDSDLKPGTQCLVAGWGATHSKDKKASDVLREVNIGVIERTICNDKEHYNSKPIVTLNMVCAGDKKGLKDSCIGDSGGPLMCKNEQKAIVSFGKPSRCADRQYPGVYTLLRKKYLKWIAEITGGDLE
uniref:Peptidase S1 domain-containing protein n=2 Tax=Varanus komodoensis TaxID=61221 RepID=A0A8D2IN26_VARKO